MEETINQVHKRLVEGSRDDEMVSDDSHINLLLSLDDVKLERTSLTDSEVVYLKQIQTLQQKNKKIKIKLPSTRRNLLNFTSEVMRKLVDDVPE